MKIFGIGLNKTGTTTLDKCGELLGYRVKGCDKGLLQDFRDGNFQRFDPVISRYDLFQDWPWPLMYRYLDETYPGSKFILTTRISDSAWLDSLKSHSMRTGLDHCRLLAYGYEYPQENETSHIDQYNSHNANVREYFSNRADDFLELCWERGDGWSELCSFLNKEIPNIPLPHANRALSQTVNLQRKRVNEERLQYLLRPQQFLHRR